MSFLHCAWSLRGHCIVGLISKRRPEDLEEVAVVPFRIFALALSFLSFGRWDLAFDGEGDTVGAWDS